MVSSNFIDAILSIPQGPVNPVLGFRGALQVSANRRHEHTGGPQLAAAERDADATSASLPGRVSFPRGRGVARWSLPKVNATKIVS